MSESVLDFDPELIFRLTQEVELEPDSQRPLLRAVRQAWRRELTEKQRRYLHLYYSEVMTMREIAGRCGVDISTVSRTLRRARMRLRRVLQYYITEAEEP